MGSINPANTKVKKIDMGVYSQLYKSIKVGHMAHPSYWPQKEGVMREQFVLTQLYKSGTEYLMGTCHVRDIEDGDRFECTIKGDNDFKDALWRFFKEDHNTFKDRKVDVEFSDVNSIGLPTDACIVWIYGFSTENNNSL